MIRRSTEGANCRAIFAAMELSGLCETQVLASRGREDGEVGCEGVRCAPTDGVRGGRFGDQEGSRLGVVDGGARVARQEGMVDMAHLYRAVSPHIRAFRWRSTPPWPRRYRVPIPPNHRLHGTE